jgi:hypothetical protein
MAFASQFLLLVGTLAALIFRVRTISYSNLYHLYQWWINTRPFFIGKILDVGADWGLVDPQTNVFSADTRYNFRTDDGADIFLQTAGPKAPDGHLHLRIIFETGSPKYYWLNNVVGEFHAENKWPNHFLTKSNPAIGILTSNQPTNKNISLLRIDAWNVSLPDLSSLLSNKMIDRFTSLRPIGTPLSS